jgi:hypothetical protein
VHSGCRGARGVTGVDSRPGVSVRGVVSSGDGAKCVVLCLDKRGVAAKRLRAGCMQSVGRWQLIPSGPLIGSLKQTLFLM